MASIFNSYQKTCLFQNSLLFFHIFGNIWRVSEKRNSSLHWAWLGEVWETNTVLAAGSLSNSIKLDTHSFIFQSKLFDRSITSFQPKCQIHFYTEARDHTHISKGKSFEKRSCIRWWLLWTDRLWFILLYQNLIIDKQISVHIMQWTISSYKLQISAKHIILPHFKQKLEKCTDNFLTKSFYNTFTIASTMSKGVLEQHHMILQYFVAETLLAYNQLLSVLRRVGSFA